MKKNQQRKPKKSGASTPHPLREKILDFYSRNKTKKISAHELAKKLKVKDVPLLIQQLDILVEKKTLVRNDKNHYGSRSSGHPPGATVRYEGYVDMARAGFAYIICKMADRDIYVAQKNLKGAEDGDLVMVELIRDHRSKPEGRVSEILQRSRNQIIGIVRFFNKQAIAYAQTGSKMTEVTLEVPKDIPVEDFDRVVVLITRFKQNPRDLLHGRVIRNLGKETSIDVEMQSILAEKGFPLEWSDALLAAVERIPVETELHPYRKDYRSVTTFTIDPFDAKDFDDALSVEKNEIGGWDIGVHIADVSHYVEAQSALDKEAVRRGNSVYLVDRVLPMLPEKLSNHLCSLRPHEDKYCFSIIFRLDGHYEIQSQWIGKTLIHSNHRFTYEEAQEILDKGEGIYRDELHLLNQIAVRYRKKRMENGAIDFDSEEVKFRLDDAGKPIELIIKERKPAHMLIEEFMLLANKYVAEYMALKNKEKPIPFVYRIHDKPDPDKLEEFAMFALEMGVSLDLSSPKKISTALNKLTQLAQLDEGLKILQPLAIRSMAKAEYNIENIGHFGLAFKHYTHFTSPIRRYSDLVVHRILFANLQESYRMDADLLQRQCLHISNQERKAMEAERTSTRFFQVYYLKDRIGEIFEGRIIGMNDNGFFLELAKVKCEGFLPYSQVQEDMALHKSRFSASSALVNKKWKIGDKLQVKLADADLNRKELLLSYF
ncbi:MAG TPA: ribonuclease R [Saprospiraceae bacterium]|nr:ribonuclease R [Saprospiraceae bacterium]